MAGPLDNRAGAAGGVRPQQRLQVVDRDGAVPARRPISVLYVEDDEDDVFMMRRRLDGLPSFSVDFAHAPRLSAARSMLDRHRFDVVLCDFWLGCETTIPLIDDLKSAVIPCPVVLVSSLENDDIELIGRRAGAAGFVAKADLSSAALDRIFATLLPGEDRTADPDQSVARWLRGLLRGLDRVHAASAIALGDQDELSLGTHEMLSEIASDSAEIRADILDKLAGLERATRRNGGATIRFDAVPYLVDAVSALRMTGIGTVNFVAPLVPIPLETNPTLFGDLMQGFFAEAQAWLSDGGTVTVTPMVRAGRLDVMVEADGAPRPAAETSEPEAAREAAAAETRRFLVETLARAIGGDASFVRAVDEAARYEGRLQVPLRAGPG